MKRFIILLASAILAFTACDCGCSYVDVDADYALFSDTEHINVPTLDDTKVGMENTHFIYRGHDYILFRFYGYNERTIVHDPDCHECEMARREEMVALGNTIHASIMADLNERLDSLTKVNYNVQFNDLKREIKRSMNEIRNYMIDYE